ncbi:MAG: SufD family Fe-S cluster assembly protein, partial [Clostridia bacterium]|nr:SufD family Fe-S cluster assembly protein [Clostridia bacterium]
MIKLDEIQKRILREVADLHEVPEGAFNIRSDGRSVGRQSTANIEIVPKTDVSGLEIHIKPNTRNESVHIPVVMTKSGLKEVVYNDFFIGEGADVVIVAGCGIDNCGNADSEHDGIHRFYVGRGAKVKYVEKHYGSGDGKGKRILNPGTEVYQEEDSVVEMEMVQIKGVDDTERTTVATLKAGAK